MDQAQKSGEVDLIYVLKMRIQQSGRMAAPSGVSRFELGRQAKAGKTGRVGPWEPERQVLGLEASVGGADEWRRRVGVG